MTTYFLDASALVKRYLVEVGTLWIAQLTDPASGNPIVIVEITQVEVAAAIASRHRAPQGISRRRRDAAVDLLAKHIREQYRLAALTAAILARAVDLTQVYRLRGYDAVQLSTALGVRDSLLASGLPPLTFLAADSDLIKAASAEGLLSDNPNLHG
jgi:predicted nucleic acid-binding protein